MILVVPSCVRGGEGKAQRVPNYPEGAKLQKGEDSKGSVIRATHSKVPRCRRGALKSAALQEGRAGFGGFGASWLCSEGAMHKIRVLHWQCKRRCPTRGQDSEGSALSRLCSEMHEGATFCTKGKAQKGLDPRSTF